LNPSATITVNSFIPILSKWKSAPSGVPDPDRKFKFGIALMYKFAKSDE
jgi:hypothetical protein